MDDFESDFAGDAFIGAVDFNEHDYVSNSIDFPTFESPTRTEFPGFPYPKPYPQQTSLMQKIYSILVERKCGIIESPTGTGKSLTLLTSCLHWLLDHNACAQRYLERLSRLREITNKTISPSPEWIEEFSRRRELRGRLNREILPLEWREKALAKIRNLTSKTDLLKLKSEKLRQKPFPSSSVFHPSEKTTNQILEDDYFLLNDISPIQSKFSNIGNNTEDTSDDQHSVLQIIYCSRTHSQLTQVMSELKKMHELTEHISILCLASRQLLCVNESVVSLKNPTLVNEACLDLVGKNPGCRYRSSTSVNLLSDYMLGAKMSALDSAVIIRKCLDAKTEIEDVPVHACPYYANRVGLPLAQLILAPYQMVIMPALRKASGIKLGENVLIFDEAHNLLEAVAASFSTTITHSQLKSALLLLGAYLNHYRSRLSSISILRLRQLQEVSRCAADSMESRKFADLASQRRYHLSTESSTVKCEQEAVLKVEDWLFWVGIDHINFHYLVDYLKESHCVQKIVGFGKWIKNRKCSPVKPSTGVGLNISKCFSLLRRSRFSDEQPTESKRPKFLDGLEVNKNLESCGGSLLALLAFLESLLQSEDDGRVIIRPLSRHHPTGPENSSFLDDESTDGHIRFIVLNPGRYLHAAVQESRSVFLVGGTMKPFDEFIDQVFIPAGKNATDVTLFSCDHVIDPKNQMLIYPMATSLKGCSWDFTFRNRCNQSLINACGEFILGVCDTVPGGVVVFFASFDYLGFVWNQWKSSGLLLRLQKVKKLFMEPRKSSLLSQIMEAYVSLISNGNGACIVCVIGGKLSEGINFNDDLARAVIIVGLPYPNVNSVVMREKMKYLNREFSSLTSLPHPIDKLSPGRRFCETICMRSVNQAIGRAIRHAKDYAAVFLLDERFVRTSVRNGLPGWAQSAILSTPPSSESELRNQLKAFLEKNKLSCKSDFQLANKI